MKIIFKIPGISFKLKVRNSLLDEVIKIVEKRKDDKNKNTQRNQDLNEALNSLLQDIFMPEDKDIEVEETDDPQPQFRTKEIAPRKKPVNGKKPTYRTWTDEESKIMVENLSLKPKELYAKFPVLRSHTMLALSVRKSAIVRKNWKSMGGNIKKLYEEHIKSKQEAQSGIDQQGE